MKKSKFLILLVTLSFPVILYLFLRSYGQNQFALPVFFDGEEKVLCTEPTVHAQSEFLYSLDQADSLALDEMYQADYKIVHFPNSENAEIQTLKNELNRVLNTFDNLSINILSFKSVGIVSSDIENARTFLDRERASTYLYSIEQKDDFVNCIFAFPTKDWDGEHPAEIDLPVENTVVLLDDENKIRGYYDGYETKEVDRLILEIRVLLSNR